MSKCVISFSGGMDSTVLLYQTCKEYDEVLALFFKYGQRHIKEYEYAKYHVNKLKKVVLKSVDVTFFKDIATQSSLLNNDIAVARAKDVMGDPQTVNYVPFRNMMLLSIASAAAETFGAHEVFYGAAQADSVAGYWDGSEEFLEAVNKVNILNRRNKITISAPLIEMSKSDIIKKGLDLGVEYDKTWTCYEGKEKACGECTACSLRLKGFIDAGLPDPLLYSKSIDWRSILST